MSYRVHIRSGDVADPFLTTIYVQEDYGTGRRFLTNDGRWVVVAEGTTPDPSIGLRVPTEAMEALAEAIDRMQGAPSHARTESAVLREWLAVERKRVDEALAK